jgi:hypothetical protein
MPRNAAVAASHVCPGIRIHIMDMVEPPEFIISLMEKLSEKNKSKARRRDAEKN